MQPTNEGDGEIWVVIRQGQVPLVNLILRPRIVTNAAAPRAESTRRRHDGSSGVGGAAASTTAFSSGGKVTRFPTEFIFDSPTLNLNSIYDSGRWSGDRNSYVNNLYKEIEDRWVSNRRRCAAPSTKICAHLAADLWDELFPAGCRPTLWQHRDDIPQHHGFFRRTIHSVGAGAHERTRQTPRR